MDEQCLTRRGGETAAHLQLKRAALLWAQAQGYSVCATEVSLPRCRYRADLAAYRPQRGGIGSTAIFECKQARADLRRDNLAEADTRQRLTTLCHRRDTLERCLRVHYPRKIIRDSLFPEYDTHDLEAIQHRGYTRVRREILALQRRLTNCAKFGTLARYRCANLFYLVLPERLFDRTELPFGWGALVERTGNLFLAVEPLWHECGEQARITFLERVGAAATRRLGRDWQITFEHILEARAQSVP